LIEYRPSKSVDVPIVVPFTTTVAPGKGIPPSETIPVTYFQSIVEKLELTLIIEDVDSNLNTKVE
jgi:hypothetical protein